MLEFKLPTREEAMKFNFKQKVEFAKALIRYTIEKYKNVTVGCSFGKDSMVLVHLAQQIKPDIPVFTVMTRYKPKETLDYKYRMTNKMKINVKEYRYDGEIPAELYKTDPDRCCYLLKVKPTKEALKGMDAWFAGLRRTEGRTRNNYEYIEEKGGLIKVNPILDFTEAEIWMYMAINKIEPNPLYAEGYRSLGCAPCSRPGGDTERAGRWAGTSKCGGECGIHTQNLR